MINRRELFIKTSIITSKRRSEVDGEIQMLEESLPYVLRSDSFWNKFKNEVKVYHRWLGIIFYYSPVFFFCLLRKCYEKPSISQQLLHLIKIGLTTILSFTLLWLPFCLFHDVNETCITSLLHVLSRQFPFSRGIFEDKVAIKSDY
jgi:hypothetical protein